MGDYTYQEHLDMYGGPPLPGEAMFDPGEAYDRWRDEQRDGVICATCHGEGTTERGLYRDYFGTWETETYRCADCDGTGSESNAAAPLERPAARPTGG